MPSDGTACAVLQPAVAEAARRAAAAAVTLVDVGPGVAGALNLDLDRVRTTYSDGTALGPPSAEVRLGCRIAQGRGVPTTPVPPVAARTSLPARALLEDPSTLVDRLPADALPVLLTTWALSRLRPPARQRFLAVVRDLPRPLAWVSVEGVGVAPSVQTLGDRPASGHSLVGLALLDEQDRPTETVARCWSRGRVLAWLAERPDADRAR